MSDYPHHATKPGFRRIKLLVWKHTHHLCTCIVLGLFGGKMPTQSTRPQPLQHNCRKEKNSHLESDSFCRPKNCSDHNSLNPWVCSQESHVSWENELSVWSCLTLTSHPLSVILFSTVVENNMLSMHLLLEGCYWNHFYLGQLHPLSHSLLASRHSKDKWATGAGTVQ